MNLLYRLALLPTLLVAALNTSCGAQSNSSPTRPDSNPAQKLTRDNRGTSDIAATELHPASGSSSPEQPRADLPSASTDASATAANPTYGTTPPPPPGIHPRICLVPSEIPELRERIKVEPARSGYEACRKLLHQLNSNEAGGLLPIIVRMENHSPLSESEREQVAGALRDGSLVALLEPEVRPIIRRALMAYVRAVNPTDPKLDFPRNGPGIAFAYDWAFDALTDGERSEVRDWLSRGCALAEVQLNERHWGFKPLEAGETSSNWTTFITGAFGITSVAIEGEPGSNPRWYQKAADRVSLFLENGIGAEGAPYESIHYFAYGMTNGVYFLDAMQRRGYRVWSNSHLSQVPEYWLHDMFPFGADFNSLQDTRDLHTGCEDIYDRLHLAYPKSPVMQEVYELYLQNLNTQVVVNSGRALWAMPPDPTVAAHFTSQPLVRFFRDNGLLYARSSWARDASYLSVQSDPALAGPSHAHADRNSFTFAALGRLWAMDGGGWLPQDIFHNEVLIDGKGEGYFPQRGRVVDFQQNEWAAAITGDAKLAYDYMTTFAPSSPPMSPGEWRDVQGYWSSSYNPVQAAYRTAVFVRGDHPYAIIIDNIQKDDQPHEYQWRMLTPLSNRATLLKRTAGIQLQPFDVIAPTAYVPIPDERPKPLNLTFTTSQNQNCAVWILAGHETWEPWNWSVFYSFDASSPRRVLLEAGDSARTHWQLLTRLAGDSYLRRGAHTISFGTMGPVWLQAMLIAPPDFDPRQPFVQPPEDATVIRVDSMPLPAGWRKATAQDVSAQLDILLVSPDRALPSASLFHCVRPDNHEDHGYNVLITATIHAIRPDFRVILWPHIEGEPPPAITSSPQGITLRWADGTFDALDFGSQLTIARSQPGKHFDVLRVKLHD